MEAILRNFFYDIWIKRFILSITSIIVIICFLRCLTIFISQAEANNINKKPKVEAFIVNSANINQDENLFLMANKDFDFVVSDNNYDISLEDYSFIDTNKAIAQALDYNLNEDLITLNIKEKEEEEPVVEKGNEVKSSFYTIITAYNSEATQCDSSPCITANGYNLCKYNKEDSVAINNLSFGTKIRIPAVFGDKIFTVRDRMHSKYYNRVDIWMIDKEEAVNFGYKRAKVEIIN